ncbi:MAG TPA: histidine--tRNA ligase [Mycobacteriales bacterium]|nr:histidine--tRNA ligase [Mycobacteriales bacterium]
MSTFQAPKGVAEYVPPESSAWLAVRDGLAAPAKLAGYGYLELPVFEDTALFSRGVGESTDVVTKEMYTFSDRGERSLTLRPEGTAGVVRAVLEHNLHRGQLPVKVWYAGPFFRAERPQAGRYRQFSQVGIEAIGSDDPAVDAEVITVAYDGYRGLGLQRFTLELNSLGDAECRPAYREKLQEFLRALDLDEDTRRRVEINPLRVLDDKRDKVRQQVADAPLIGDHLCDACRAHYDDVRGFLADLGIEWREAPGLVRGLDYYTRTTFEFVHDGLGAQSGIGGGGRYDGLSETLGGPPLPGIGFGLGVDRTLLALQSEDDVPAAPASAEVFAVPVGANARRELFKVVGRLRRGGVAADMAYGDRGLKGAMKAAGRSGARLAIVLGDRDLAEGVAQLKDLATGEQEAVALSELVATVEKRLS